MCQYFKVSKSGYYDWDKREPSMREQKNQKILGEIKMIHNQSKKKVYGAPRLHKDLLEKGIKCSKNRVARIMRSNGIRAKIRRRFKVTTNSSHNYKIFPNLLASTGFKATKRNEVWTSDITYIRTKEGWLYLAVVLDIYNRKIIGWAMDKRMKQELVLKAIKQAVLNEKPEKGIIFHSDRGSQYASNNIREYLFSNGFRQSMSAKGNCYDNAITETFFKTLKTECIKREIFRTRNEAKLNIFDYIEIFYNRERRHSALGYVSPVQFEKLAA